MQVVQARRHEAVFKRRQVLFSQMRHIEAACGSRPARDHEEEAVEYGTASRKANKRIYGLLESQFKTIYERAEKMRGATGENMLRLLELRLDNIVFRFDLGKSRAQARQIVNHAFLTVNGRPVNIPSYTCKVGDVIAVKGNKKGSKLFEEFKSAKKINLPKWLEFDVEKLEGKVIALPQREDIDLTISENMIVELYSR